VAEGLATGKIKPGDKQVDGGSLGSRPIEGDHVMLGDILVFTRENIDQYNF
jgi:hypothetical protein